VHVDGVELALRPGNGGTVVIKKVFSSTTDRAFNPAARKMQQALGDIKNRQLLHQKATAMRDYLRTLGTEQATARAGELTFLIHALQKLGI
jgi:hypothetical protein